jgi:hypothetical protein
MSDTRVGGFYIWGMKKYATYKEIEVDHDYTTFDFISEGCNGKIPKRVEFMPTPFPNVYNLSFGDTKHNGELDDKAISNNGDRNKILATILYIVDTYTRKYPEHWVFFSGSTENRTRLYRMAVSLHLEELSEMFEILVDLNGDWTFVRFQKGLNIKAFLIKRKMIKFEL